MIKFVKLVEVYPAGVTTKTFTHEIINDDSVIEVYTEDANIYPIATTQSGNTVTISIVDHDEPVEVCVTINNMVSYSEPLYTSNILVPSPIEDYPLDVELFNIKGELQSIPFEYVGNEAFEALQTEVNGKAPQTEVSAIKESLTQITEELKQSLSQLELKEINPTLSGNFGVSDLKAYKSANVVYISCTVTVSSNLTANTALMTIPYKPVSPLHFCDIRNNYSPYANVGRSGFIRGSNGVFELPNGLSAGTYYINATYICL